MSDDQELIPIEQHALTFYGKPIIVVRLPDGRPGVVLRFLCENLYIDTSAQVQRVQRSEAMAEDLVFTRVETASRSATHGHAGAALHRLLVCHHRYTENGKRRSAPAASFSTSGKPWMSSTTGLERHR